MIALIMSSIVGLCVGSFLNVVIYRLPKGMSLAKPTSHCTTCDYSLRWYDNIPVLSYLMLGGKCRKCKQKISPRYMIVELLNAILWAGSVLLFFNLTTSGIVTTVVSCVLSSVLISVAFIDLDEMIILDRFNIIIAVLGVVMIFFDPFTVWYDHLIGSAVAGLVFGGVYYGSRAILKKEGMGFGDVKLSVCAGLLLGWQRFILSMLIASLSACFILLPLRRRGEEGREYPFAPFITFGVLVAFLFGAEIITAYINLIL